MKVAVVGSGSAGLAAAYALAKSGAEVVFFQAQSSVEDQPGSVSVNGTNLDPGFILSNPANTNALGLSLLDEVGVNVEPSQMSFAVSVEGANGNLYEWASNNGFSSLFAQRSNMLSPTFWRFLYQIRNFGTFVTSYLENAEKTNGDAAKETVGQFLQSHGYSKEFQQFYLLPMCASIWSCTVDQVLGFSAVSVLSFFHNHHLLQITGPAQLFTIKSDFTSFNNQIVQELKKRNCEVRTGGIVDHISVTDRGVVIGANGMEETFESCVLATNAPDALNLLNDCATFEERRILGAYQYTTSNVYLHSDKDFMPKSTAAWSAWNFVGSNQNNGYVTYWLNTLQNLGATGRSYFMTIDPPSPPSDIISKWTISHPVPSTVAAQAAKELADIQGKRGIWFCGACQGYGSHEDVLMDGVQTAYGLLGERQDTLSFKKQMPLSWSDAGARLVVIAFFKQFVKAGCIILQEDGGAITQFQGNMEEYNRKSILQIHDPAFYWKIATRADIGLADAYIDGDFTFVDKEEGLLNLLLVLIANRDINHATKKQQGRRWWAPIVPTAVYWSTLMFMRHVSRKNSLTQARRNISQHYDLSNVFFSLFLDETMSYSSGLFTHPEETLKESQYKKLHSLIDKAHIESHHEVLDIGCGWGSLGIETVKKTGCKYTGVTLSKEQLKLAQERVKAAGLEDRISLHLMDYREVPGYRRFNRIISCEMLEHVGEEYFEEFFRSCDHLLAEDGLLVLQFISMPDQRYEEHKKSSDFLREYIFPGGCLPSFSRLSTAMANGSTFNIEHVENIGPHYALTLLHWRKNLLSHVSELKKLGYNDKFIRTWEYYFVYCASGFKSLTLHDYQVVYSRPGKGKAWWKGDRSYTRVTQPADLLES